MDESELGDFARQDWLARARPLVHERRHTRNASGRDGPRIIGGRAELASLLAQGQTIGLVRGRPEFSALGKLVGKLDNWRSQVVPYRAPFQETKLRFQ
jgi:hypothetical protein